MAKKLHYSLSTALGLVFSSFSPFLKKAAPAHRPAAFLS
jgi:hypothetical protein